MADRERILPTTGPLAIPLHDYGSVAYPDSTTEVYTFKVDGSSGTTVCVITLVYTDATKASLASFTKTG